MNEESGIQPGDFTYLFEWDDGNEVELARHHISPEEVEQVFDDEAVWARNRRNRAGGSVVYGRTYGGRLLTVIVMVKEDDAIRPITGWDMATGERTRYLRRKR